MFQDIFIPLKEATSHDKKYSDLLLPIINRSHSSSCLFTLRIGGDSSSNSNIRLCLMNKKSTMKNEISKSKECGCFRFELILYM